MSKLRDYVTKMFENNTDFSREEVYDLVSKKYGIGKYSEKQVQNLLYNMKRADIIVKSDDGKKYKLKRECVSENKQDVNQSFSINDYINEIYELGTCVKEGLNQNKFLERYKGLDLNVLSQLYSMNEELLKNITKIRKCIDMDMGDTIRFNK